MPKTVGGGDNEAEENCKEPDWNRAGGEADDEGTSSGAGDERKRPSNQERSVNEKTVNEKTPEQVPVEQLESQLADLLVW